MNNGFLPFAAWPALTFSTAKLIPYANNSGKRRLNTLISPKVSKNTTAFGKACPASKLISPGLPTRTLNTLNSTNWSTK